MDCEIPTKTCELNKNLLLEMLEKLYAHKNEVDKELLWIIVQIIFNIPDNKERLSVTQPGLYVN